MGLMPTQDILYGGRYEKILLFESQLLASISRIVRVEDTCNVLSSLSRLQCIVVLSSVECEQIELIERQ